VQRMLLKTAIVLLMSSTALAQSLGDVARENREKKTQDASAAPAKVITNADLPKDPNPAPAPREAQSSATAASSQGSNHRSADQRVAEQRAAQQWKRQILIQKNKMAALQARIDRLNPTIRTEYGTVQYDGPANRYQARQMARAAQLQQQLDEQKRKLEQMQEAARHAGMHTPVYDP